LAFAPACRLVRRSEFEAVYHSGQRQSSKQFVVFFRPNRAERTRFGISVKRALGGAVVRNRIRRRVREILRRHRQGIASGWDIVIHPRSTVAQANFGALAAELIELLRSAVGSAPTSRRPATTEPGCAV